MKAIEVRGLTRTYGTFTAVDHVSFEVERGEIFGYLGANGAGKSTTIKMLCGLQTPSSGEARVAGFDIAREAAGVKRSIGYMSQKFSLYLDLPVSANLEFFGGAYGLAGAHLRRRLRSLVEELDLGAHQGDVAGALSGGVRQKLALACALLHEPPIVFLDEPTAGVDPPSRRGFWRLIRGLAAGGTTVFVTTHYMDEAEYCDRIGMMVAGRLVALDTPEALKRDLVPHPLWLVGDRPAASLRETPGVRAVRSHGAQLLVELEPGTRLPFGKQIEPTLEDVFVAAVVQHERRTT